jgi:hypothetical protein
VLGVSVGNSDVMVLSVSSGVVSLDYGGLSAGLPGTEPFAIGF